MKQHTRPISWFPGLNGLRFMAAFLVIIMHVHLALKQNGLATWPEFPVLLKGFHAVSFFFVLSGFLITYLLLAEQTKTRSISIKKFYWRRVFRIWPLYFGVVGFGLLFYWIIVPALGISFEINYSLSWAAALYLFFGANLMNSLFHVGGILHVTWSIAVEEQFYLFWAPLVKRFRSGLPWMILIVGLFFLILNGLNAVNGFELSAGWQLFVHTLQFHYMAIGAGAAWLVYHKKAAVLQWPIFTSRLLQVALSLVILVFFLAYQKQPVAEALLPLPLGLLFAWLIVNVSVNPKRVFSCEGKALNFLGTISYGLYMLHMPVVYAVAFGLQTVPQVVPGELLFPLALILTTSTTIGLAYCSHRWVEQPILRWGKTWMHRDRVATAIHTTEPISNH